MAADYAAYRAEWRRREQQALTDYREGITDYVVGLSPQVALEYSGVQVAELLARRLGPATFRRALDPNERLPGHVVDRASGDWLRGCNTVGVNVRTVGSFWNVLKYALTLPDHIRGIHLLPIWEPGVVGSLYGIASWNLNPEFLDMEVIGMYPRLRSTTAQLQVVINLLHAMGKVVGMDVIPHTDRYSEIVLANPAYFEWLRRNELEIVDHRADLHREVETLVLQWLRQDKPTLSYTERDFFDGITEPERLVLLFGRPEDNLRRRSRRVSLLDYLSRRGYEPVPATMAPPYRGLEVDPDPAALTIDAAGRRWRDYRMQQPTAMSRVFGPLTRFKFYERKEDNRNWEIDFSRPRPAVWKYFTESYGREQAHVNFDFMRGDMSHVQMRPGGPPATIDAHYDPLRAVKHFVARSQPSFAYFAEGFLADPDVMGYGSEVEHLVASDAEVVLGNLQSMIPGSGEFLDALTSYLEIAEATPLTPAFTVITADKDDPRFDHFHHHGEIARFFTGLFLDQLPLYYSLGYEQRDRHFSPAANEAYTKLYVFQESKGPKSVRGPWQWGGNFELFDALQSLHAFAAKLLPSLLPDRTRVAVHASGLVRWERSLTDSGGRLTFVANFGELSSVIDLPVEAEILYRWPSADKANEVDATVVSGEVRCYRVPPARGTAVPSGGPDR